MRSASWNACRALPGIKVFMGSSTGDLLVEDDAGVREILSNIRPPRGLSFRRMSRVCASGRI
jgi:hypothetical protein